MWSKTILNLVLVTRTQVLTCFLHRKSFLTNMQPETFYFVGRLFAWDRGKQWCFLLHLCAHTLVNHVYDWHANSLDDVCWWRCNSGGGETHGEACQSVIHSSWIEYWCCTYWLGVFAAQQGGRDCACDISADHVWNITPVGVILHMHHMILGWCHEQSSLSFVSLPLCIPIMHTLTLSRMLLLCNSDAPCPSGIPCSCRWQHCLRHLKSAHVLKTQCRWIDSRLMSVTQCWSMGPQLVEKLMCTCALIMSPMWFT